MDEFIHKRKMIGETADYRFKRDTRDYLECVERDTWRTEQKIAEEIIDAVKRLELNLKLDRLTEYRYNSFPIALLQQLKREDIYIQLNQELKKLADEMDTKLLRKEIVSFIKSSSHRRIREFKIEYKESSEAEKMPWNKYWDQMLNPSWTGHWFIQAAAWFMNLDIDIVKIESDKPNRLFKVSGMLDSSDGEANMNRKEIGPLFMGQKTDIHFQSLLPMDTKQEKKSTGKRGMSYDNKYNVKKVKELQIEPDEETICPNCKHPFKYILMHAAAKKSGCYGKIDQEFLNRVKEEAKAKKKARNRVDKARSRDLNQNKETMKERTDRLALQAYYMKRWRNLKREYDYELAKKEARDQKRESRENQKFYNSSFGTHITQRSYTKKK